MDIAERIKQYRMSHGLTLRQFADIVGCSYGEVQRVETRRNKISVLGQAKWTRIMNNLEKKEGTE